MVGIFLEGSIITCYKKNFVVRKKSLDVPLEKNNVQLSLYEGNLLKKITNGCMLIY